MKDFLRSLWILPALFFITAALSKSIDPLSFLYELADYNLSLPIGFQAALALFLPFVEAMVGLLLLFGGLRSAAVGAILLLVAFSAGVLLGLPEGYLQRCGCLGPENLEPGVALVKNALLLIFLTWGFNRASNSSHRGNPWGAFALVAGGSWTGALPLLAIYGLGAALAALGGKKHLLWFAAGLVLGIAFDQIGLPILLLPVLGTVVYFWKIEPPPARIRPAALLGISVLLLTAFQFINPPILEREDHILKSGLNGPSESSAIGYRHSERGCRLVIWVTGGLKAQWLPQNLPNKPESGGLLRLARALELYRQPGDLLVDLGRFRYPEGISGETRARRIQADGVLKALARMNYTALNVSLLDLDPWPPELAARANEYNLPLVSSNIGAGEPLFPPLVGLSISNEEHLQIIGLSGGSNEFKNWLKAPHTEPGTAQSQPTFRILISDASLEDIQSFCESWPDVNLVIWLSDGDPSIADIAGIPILGMGSSGTCLGRIEVEDATAVKLSIDNGELSGWQDGKPYVHHPVREKVFSDWAFWRKEPRWRAYLWAVPAALSPQKLAETQMRQTAEEDSCLTELERVHRQTRNQYAGPQRCLSCHDIAHPRDLAKIHQPGNPEAIAGYPVYERCLGCHATGFDQPGGFLRSWERPDLRWVSCEACHGAGYDHALEGLSPFPPIPEESLCQNCHRPEDQPSDHPEPSQK